MKKKLVIIYDTESGDIKYENPDDLSTFEALGMVECFKMQMALDHWEEAVNVLPKAIDSTASPSETGAVDEF